MLSIIKTNFSITLSLLLLFLNCACSGRKYRAEFNADTFANEQGSEYNPSLQEESYAYRSENDFLSVARQPLSAFSIDVDAASYSNVRRFIREGQMPPAEAVRTEELINYFDYDYPKPSSLQPFSITTELSTCPWNANHQLMHIGLQGRKLNAERMPASNLVFLLDVSGSMDSPDKLPLLKQAFRLLTRQLRKQDRVAIVVYAGAAGLVLPSTPGNEEDVILEALENLQAGGSTAGGEGLQLAYQVARQNWIRNGNNRIILATDGDFNVGLSSDEEMVRLIEEERQKGIMLSVIGFGTGNLKDSKMEAIADNGNGNYYYIDNEEEANKVFVTEMTGTLLAIAKDVKIQVEFNPAWVKSYRLIGYENRLMSKEEFKDREKDAGEIGAGHSVTALYELELQESAQQQQLDDLRYQPNNAQNESVRSTYTDELLTLKVRYKEPKSNTSKELIHRASSYSIDLNKASDNFRFSAAVAAYGMLITDSKYKGEANMVV